MQVLVCDIRGKPHHWTSKEEAIILKYKKEYFYGDCHLEEWGHYFPLIGARLKVQILNIFWVTYFSFEYKK